MKKLPPETCVPHLQAHIGQQLEKLFKTYPTPDHPPYALVMLFPSFTLLLSSPLQYFPFLTMEIWEIACYLSTDGDLTVDKTSVKNGKMFLGLNLEFSIFR